jgi:hypothetical protein
LREKSERLRLELSLRVGFGTVDRAPLVSSSGPANDAADACASSKRTGLLGGDATTVRVIELPLGVRPVVASAP